MTEEKKEPAVKEVKATDLLQQILNEQKEILGFLKNLNFNYQILLSKFNESDKIKKVVEQLPNATPAPIKKQPEKISNLKKIVVQQKILYPNNLGPVALAQVRIYDENKKEIKEVKTQFKGTWSSILDPGSYFIHVVKPAVEAKPQVDLYYPIQVSGETSPLVLEDRCEQ